MIEVLKQALTDAKRNERHNNVAETRYWLNQYKLIAEQAIAELEKQEPVAWHVDFGNDDEPNYASLEKPNEPKATVRPLVFGDTSPPQRQQEPVAWLIVEGEDCFATNEKSYAFSFPENCRTELVVRNPPQRQWVGLTPQERDEINEQVYGAVPHHVAFHHAIEAKLKEKNT